MRVTVVGSGYVGLVAGACLAETGNDVICADVDARKIARLQASDIPIYEPGLDAMVQRNQQEGRLRFTTDVGTAVEHGQVIFIAVGTPPGEDGSADLQHVLSVARTVGQHMRESKVVVTPTFAAEFIVTAPKAVVPPTAPVKVMSPVPAVRPRVHAVAAAESSVEPKLMALFVVVSTVFAVSITGPA